MDEQQQIVPVAKNVEAQYVDMMVPLYSWGCERKIKKALANLKGIYSVNVEFPKQKVTVWGICDKSDVLSIVKKKRKGARFWESEDNIDHHHQESSSKMRSHRSFNLNSLSFSLSLSMIKRRSSSSLNWNALKKAFKRSNSF